MLPLHKKIGLGCIHMGEPPDLLGQNWILQSLSSLFNNWYIIQHTELSAHWKT